MAKFPRSPGYVGHSASPGFNYIGDDPSQRFGPRGPNGIGAEHLREPTFHIPSWGPILHAIGYVFQKDIEENLLDHGRYSHRKGEMNHHIQSMFEQLKRQMDSSGIFPHELVRDLRIEIINHPMSPEKIDLRVVIGGGDIGMGRDIESTSDWNRGGTFPKSNIFLRILNEFMNNPSEFSEKYAEDIANVKRSMNVIIKEKIDEVGKGERNLDSAIKGHKKQLNKLNKEIEKLENMRTDVMEKMREKVKSFELKV